MRAIHASFSDFLIFIIHGQLFFEKKRKKKDVSHQALSRHLYIQPVVVKFFFTFR